VPGQKPTPAIGISIAESIRTTEGATTSGVRALCGANDGVVPQKMNIESGSRRKNHAFVPQKMNL
jgi:hypothetical protein